MIYPQPDQSGVEAARQKYAAAIGSAEATRANLAAAKATAANATAARARLIRQAAGGASVSTADHQEAEVVAREATAAVGRHEAILTQQERAVQTASAEITQAQALSHMPRLVAAIAARADAATTRTAAVAAQQQAEARMREAHEVALAAFAAGHPMPPGAPRGVVYSAAEFESALWSDSSPAAIQALWGALAAEALVANAA